MNLAQLCPRDIVSVSANATVRQAAELMRIHHVGALALTDPGDGSRVVGIVTDRDMVINLLAQGHSPDERQIGSLGSAKLIGVPGTASLQEAVQAMQQHGVRRLFLLQPDGALMGLVSMDDLLLSLAEQLSALAQALRHGIQREDERSHPAQGQYEIPGHLYLVRHEP
jgi:CBS domain-containing protein